MLNRLLTGYDLDVIHHTGQGTDLSLTHATAVEMVPCGRQNHVVWQFPWQLLGCLTTVALGL